MTFDGTHISVFDLKREIILNNRMGNGKDFDLGVFDNVTGEGMSSFLLLASKKIGQRPGSTAACTVCLCPSCGFSATALLIVSPF